MKALKKPLSSAMVFAVAAIPLCALAWKFHFVCDDALISFRYAEHLAHGNGLRFNLSESVPVEGYSEPLWVVLMAGVIALGIDPLIASQVISVASAVLLLLMIIRYLDSTGAGAWATIGAALFFAFAPPVAIWSTGGMATMPFALAVFALFAAMVNGNTRAAVALGAVTVLLRADGICFAVLACASVVAAFRDRRRVQCAAWVLAAVAGTWAANTAFRYGYHGDWLPNTARAKTGFSTLILDKGWQYIRTAIVVIPSLFIAPFLGLIGVSKERREHAAGAAIFTCGVVAYCLVVGGDFMAMFRFLLPAVPFAAICVGLSIDQCGETGGAIMVAIAIAAIAVLPLPLFNVHVLPVDLIKSISMRSGYKQPRTEVEYWNSMNINCRRWTAMAKTIAENSKTGDSLVFGSIGAVGYYTQLEIMDTHGLIERDVRNWKIEDPRLPIGHLREVKPDHFLPRNPTFLRAEIIDLANPKVEMAPFGYRNKVYVIQSPEIPVGYGVSLWVRND